MRFSIALMALSWSVRFLSSFLAEAPALSLQVVNERLESLLDDGGGDFLVLVGLVAADFLGGLDGLGQLALGFGDGRLQRLDAVGLGPEVLGDEVVIRDQGVVPAGGDDGLEVVADLLPPVDENAGTLELVEHAQRHELCLEGGEKLVADLGHLLAAVARMSGVGRSRPWRQSTKIRARRGAG